MIFLKQIFGNLLPNLIKQDFEVWKSFFKSGGKKVLLGSFDKIGNLERIKRASDIISNKFLIKLDLSRKNQVSFLVKCKSAVSLKI